MKKITCYLALSFAALSPATPEAAASAPAPTEVVPQKKQLPAPTNVTPKKMKLASYTRRIPAVVIDHYLIPVILSNYATLYFLWPFLNEHRASPLRRMIHSFALPKIIYQLIVAALNLSFKRGGLAHFLLGIKVVDANGKELNLRMLALYELCAQIPFLLANICTIILVTRAEIIKLPRDVNGKIKPPYLDLGTNWSTENEYLEFLTSFREFNRKKNLYRKKKACLRHNVQLIGRSTTPLYLIDLFIIPFLIGRPFFAYLLGLPPVKVVMNESGVRKRIVSYMQGTEKKTWRFFRHKWRFLRHKTKLLFAQLLAYLPSDLSQGLHECFIQFFVPT